MAAIKTTHNALAARLTAKSVGVKLLTMDAVSPARAPAPQAHTGVVILTASTRRNHPRRNLDTDQVQIRLMWQVKAAQGHEQGMDDVMDLEQAILDALEDLDGDWDLAAAGLEGLHHERSTRGHHSRSTGWLLVTIFLTVYRQTASTP